jgi:hypothetical protein
MHFSFSVIFGAFLGILRSSDLGHFLMVWLKGFTHEFSMTLFLVI